MALSYVWGSSNTLLTTKANLQSLRKPGALDQSRRAILGLPRTVSEAMSLARSLGETYLWVDALCIVQDGDDKKDHLNAMAAIYANAILTIVAAGGTDADQGFRGLPGISKRRHIKQKMACLTDEESVLQPSSPHIWEDAHLRPWSTRAWTFQESMCSRRLLIFANESVRWCCRTARWSEESTSNDCTSDYGKADPTFLVSGLTRLSPAPLPRHEEYEGIVSDFNKRNLRFVRDAYNAFAGISSQLSTSFEGSMISGIPEVLFDVCLLWRPLRRDKPARRRQLLPSEHGLAPPSWSWQGWEGEISLPYTWCHTNDPAGPLPIMLGGTTVWNSKCAIQASEQLNERPWTLVDNWWLWYAKAISTDIRETSGERFGTGWTKRRHGRNPGFDLLAEEYERLGEVHFYSHPLWDPSADFCFPVPLCEGNPQPPRLAQYINFDAQTGMYKLGETRGTMTRIYTLTNEPAGTLWQHDEEDEDFVLATTGELPSRPSIQLIQILGCSYPKSEAVVWEVESHDRDDYLEGLIEPKAFESVQNVIWIQWSGGIAYRKATGVVDDEVWEASQPVEINVTMG